MARTSNHHPASSLGSRRGRRLANVRSEFAATKANSNEPRVARNHRGWPHALTAIVVAVLAAAPFARAIAYPFLDWDDGLNFVENHGFRGLGAQELEWMWSTFHAGHYMPMTWMSCALDFAGAGLDPARFHATNIALHAVTAALLYLAVVELFERCGATASPARLRFAAAAGALFFAVHPLRVESVVWATERRDVLSGAFLALCVFLWLRSHRRNARRTPLLAFSVASFAASLLSKSSGMAFPFALLAIDTWLLPRVERGGTWSSWVEKLPYFALAAAAAVIAGFSQHLGAHSLTSLGELSALDRAAISSHALCSYWFDSLLPLGLSAFHELPQPFDPTPMRYGAAFAFLAVTTGVLFVRRNRSRAWSAAWTTWFVFGVLVAPVIGLVHVGQQIAADRYTYLPSFACAGGFAALCLWPRTRVLALVPALLLAALSCAAWHQTHSWRSTEALFLRVVEVEPSSYFGHHKLGTLAYLRGDFDEA